MIIVKREKDFLRRTGLFFTVLRTSAFKTLCALFISKEYKVFIVCLLLEVRDHVKFNTDLLISSLLLS